MAKMKPKGARGRAAVRRLGRNYKTGKFDKIANKAARSYEKKGVSPAKAKQIGKAVAAKVYWAKVKAKAMRRKK